MDKNNKSIQVLNRAFEILKIIKSEKSTKMSLGKIAKLANLPRSTVQRIVNSIIEFRRPIYTVNNSLFSEADWVDRRKRGRRRHP